MRQICSLAVVLVISLVTSVEAAAGQQVDAAGQAGIALISARLPGLRASETPPPSSGAVEPPAEVEQREWAGYGLKWSEWSRMTGDWDRLRTDLDAIGLSFEVATIADVSGMGTGSSGVQGLGRQLTNIGLAFDLEKIAGLRGGRVLVQHQIMGGANGASLAAASQGFSNIDADAFRRFGEVWYEQQVGARVRIKTGLVDANKEFAFVDNGADFLNPSMGFSPTIFPLPTYPDPHVGLVVHVAPTERTYAAAGLFNAGPTMGVADFRALFAMGELGLSWDKRGGGRVGIGYWRVGGRRGDGDADGDDVTLPVRTAGEYLVLDQTLWADDEHGTARSIGAFLQAGVADPSLSATSSHIGGGVVARGLVARRPNDAFGAGVTAVRVASPTSDDAVGGSEVAFDAFYRFALTKWVALKPDLQVIRYPGGDAARPALVAQTIRIEIGF